MLNVNAQTRTHKVGESLISVISVGTVFILIGVVFVLAQNIGFAPVFFSCGFFFAIFSVLAFHLLKTSR